MVEEKLGAHLMVLGDCSHLCAPGDSLGTIRPRTESEYIYT